MMGWMSGALIAQGAVAWLSLVVDDLQRVARVHGLATMRAGVEVSRLVYGFNERRRAAGPLGVLGVHGRQGRPAHEARKLERVGYSPEMGD